MLQTNLTHLTSQDEFERTVASEENVMICCGRMGPMCIPVYDAMETLEDKYPQVAFRDMAFDSSASEGIRSLPETQSFRSLPFVLYYHKGKLVQARSGIQSKQQIKSDLETSIAAAE